jgi:hypothetical protein
VGEKLVILNNKQTTEKRHTKNGKNDKKHEKRHKSKKTRLKIAQGDVFIV